MQEHMDVLVIAHSKAGKIDLKYRNSDERWSAQANDGMTSFSYT